MDDDVLQTRITASDETGPAFRSAQANAELFASKVHDVAGGVVNEVASMVAEFFTLAKAIEAAISGINKADEIRDLQNSLAVFTGSVDKAREAWEFFEKAQVQSRNTAEELAKVYRDLLPQALSRGFSQESMQQITQMLSQLGTIAGKSIDEMENGFRMLLAGRVMPGRNPLLSVLGITKADVQDLGWDQIIDKMQQVTQHFPDFGQSVESTMHKVKESILDAIGGGFNEARGSVESGMKGILDAVNSPETQSALREFGKGLAEIGPIVVREMTIAGEAIRTLFGIVEVAVGGVAVAVGSVFNGIAGVVQHSYQIAADLFDKLATMIQQHPTIAHLMGLGAQSALDLRTLQSNAQYGANEAYSLTGFGDQLKALGYSSMNAGAANINGGVGDVLASGMDHAAQSIDSATKSTSNLAAGLGLVSVTGKKAGKDVADSFKDLEDVLRSIGLKPKNFWTITPIDTVSPSVNQATLAGAQANMYGGVAGQQVGDAIKQAIEDSDAWLKAAREFAQQAADGLKTHLEGELAGLLSSALEGGAKGFISALAREFPQVAESGAKSFLQYLLGKPEGKKDSQGNYLPGEGPATTGAFGEKGAKYAQAGLDFAAIGAGGYEAGLSGQPGSRTGAVISGALAGAEFGLIGVIVGGIIGAIGGALGAQQRQKDYQYGIPVIDANGNASFTNTRNLVPTAIQQMTGRVQDTYDTYRNDYTRLLMTLGVNQMPDLGGITGKFQDNPSAHWQEHFEQWLTQTLPREIAGQFKDSLKQGFGTIGLSGEQFDSMWAKFNGLDPSKAASMLSGLADALAKINDATKFFGAGAQANIIDLTKKAGETFAQSLADSDPKILAFAASLKDLVGEDQIRAAGELGDMLKQRQEAEKAFLQSIIDAMQAGKKAAEDLGNTLQLRLLHKGDGTPDYEAQGNFLRSLADKDLARIAGAKSPGAAQSALSDYFNVLNQISSLGYNINTKTGDDWTKWAQTQLDLGTKTFDDTLKKFGDALTAADDAFMKSIQPSLDAFKGSLGGANVTIGNFTNGLGDANAAAGVLANSFSNLSAIVDRLASKMSSNSFAERTVAQRLAS